MTPHSNEHEPFETPEDASRFVERVRAEFDWPTASDAERAAFRARLSERIAGSDRRRGLLRPALVGILCSIVVIAIGQWQLERATPAPEHARIDPDVTRPAMDAAPEGPAAVESDALVALEAPEGPAAVESDALVALEAPEGPAAVESDALVALEAPELTEAESELLTLSDLDGTVARDSSLPDDYEAIASLFLGGV